jgi:hypothetical protein
MNLYLTNYGQKKSIINIQDLGLSTVNRYSIGGQPILRIIYRSSIFRRFLFLEKNLFRYESIFRKFFRISASSRYPE